MVVAPKMKQCQKPENSLIEPSKVLYNSLSLIFLILICSQWNIYTIDRHLNQIEQHLNHSHKLFLVTMLKLGFCECYKKEAFFFQLTNFIWFLSVTTRFFGRKQWQPSMGKLRKSITETNRWTFKEKNLFFCYFKLTFEFWRSVEIL